MARSSRISGFYKLPVTERADKVREFSGLESEDVETLLVGGLGLEQADRMIENVVGVYGQPLGVATNFLVNGKDYLIPMATEEPSVVAAASNAARIVRESGGFNAESTQPVMIGQIQLTCVDDVAAASKKILEEKEKLIDDANSLDPVLVKFGGGVKDVKVRILDSIVGKLLVVHLHVDVRDAMGANAVNTMCESLAPRLEEISGGKVCLRIISNYATERLARAKATVGKDALGGEDVVDGIVAAYALADADVYRAATHNKGIMNGIAAMVLATGNDTRAVEAGAHSYAARNGVYKPLSRYSKNKRGDLDCEIELPIAVGLVGGATKTHPTAQFSVKVLGVKTARELSEVMASVGLAQNLAALRALATEGIQRGHMELHARNIAVLAGAKDDAIDRIAKQMIEEKKIRVDRAKELLESKK
ncbi:MAG: hydroxymethylglutaryl-CoA reductase, degradative [Candidatus Altiarchaeota archaeon]